jgi:hypothetical protein
MSAPKIIRRTLTFQGLWLFDGVYAVTRLAVDCKASSL